jgi:hypothetical protein
MACWPTSASASRPFAASATISQSHDLPEAMAQPAAGEGFVVDQEAAEGAGVAGVLPWRSSSSMRRAGHGARGRGKARRRLPVTGRGTADCESGRPGGSAGPPPPAPSPRFDARIHAPTSNGSVIRTRTPPSGRFSTHQALALAVEAWRAARGYCASRRHSTRAHRERKPARARAVVGQFQVQPLAIDSARMPMRQPSSLLATAYLIAFSISGCRIKLGTSAVRLSGRSGCRGRGALRSASSRCAGTDRAPPFRASAAPSACGS